MGGDSQGPCLPPAPAQTCQALLFPRRDPSWLRQGALPSQEGGPSRIRCRLATSRASAGGGGLGGSLSLAGTEVLGAGCGEGKADVLGPKSALTVSWGASGAERLGAPPPAALRAKKVGPVRQALSARRPPGAPRRRVSPSPWTRLWALWSVSAAQTRWRAGRGWPRPAGPCRAPQTCWWQ